MIAQDWAQAAATYLLTRLGTGSTPPGGVVCRTVAVGGLDALRVLAFTGYPFILLDGSGGTDGPLRDRRAAAQTLGGGYRRTESILVRWGAIGSTESGASSRGNALGADLVAMLMRVGTLSVSRTNALGTETVFRVIVGESRKRINRDEKSKDRWVYTGSVVVEISSTFTPAP